MHKYKESIKKNGYEIINCETCGYWHVYPIPSVKELHDYYATKYYENLGNNRSMTDKVSDPDGFYKIKYQDKLRHILQFAPELPLNLLDIGCGYGDFLSFMRDNGWWAHGVEPSESCRKNLMSRFRVYSDLARYIEFGDKFSVVTLFNVLEHVTYPDSVLNDIKKILSPGGLIVILVPNDFSFLQKIVDKDYYFLHPLDHLNYWNFFSMKEYLKRMGITIVYETTGFPLEFFELMGEHYIGNDDIGKAIHQKRVSLERKLSDYPLKDYLYESYAQLGIGREIEVYCKIES